MQPLPSTRTRRRSLSTPIATVLLIVAAIPLVIRGLELDRGSFLLSGAVGVRGLALIPAVIGLMFAVISKKKLLVLLTLLAVAAHVMWSLPAFDRPGPNMRAEGTEISVMSVNLLLTTTELDGLATGIAAAQPDILVLVELTPTHVAELESTLDVLYPYHDAEPSRDVRGIGIWSKFPIQESTIEPLTSGSWPAVRAFIDLGRDEVQVIGVHPPPPGNARDRQVQDRELDVISRMPRDTPTIVMGDFNASAEHGVFRDFLADSGLRDAHAEAGGLYPATWPTNMFLPPLLHIDHILVNNDVEIRSATIPDFEWGGDHRPVAARLVITR